MPRSKIRRKSLRPKVSRMSSRAPRAEDPTGTYIYNPSLRRLVKVSSDIPPVASRH